MTIPLAICTIVIVLAFIAWVDPISRDLAKRGWTERRGSLPGARRSVEPLRERVR